MNKKEVYGGLLSCITAVAGIDNAKKFDTLFRDHKKLNLKNPQTFLIRCLTLSCMSSLPWRPVALINMQCESMLRIRV